MPGLIFKEIRYIQPPQEHDDDDEVEFPSRSIQNIGTSVAVQWGKRKCAPDT